MNETLLAEAVLGKDAEEFLSSDIGRYLVGCAKAEIDEAQQKLNTVSPWRRNRIRDLQNEIWRAQSVVGWLAEAVSAGRAAQSMLEEDTADD